MWIEVDNLNDPLALVATMAHELAHVHLLGHGRISAEEDDHEPLTDLLTVFLGLGVFTANSVIREKYRDDGVISSWSIRRRGYLTMPKFGYSLARFASLRGEEEPEWAGHLRPDVRAAFDQARRFLAKRAEQSAAEVACPVRWPERPPFDSIDPDPENPTHASMSAEELLDRYAGGERGFAHYDLQGLDLRGADLRNCNFAGSDLSHADLGDARLDQSNLSGASLQEAFLGNAGLCNANLSDADLSGADLSGADLTNADIRGADFTGAMLDQTNLVGTSRNRTTDFTDVDVSTAICDADLSKENLRGEMRLAGMVEWHDRISRWLLAFFFTFVAMLFGGMIGYMIGLAFAAELGGNTVAAISGAVGATLFGALFARKLFRPRPRNESGE